jgi:citrate lyase subunit beta/citryl-CoA lyase
MLNMSEIAQASDRTESMIVGADDYCLELGVEPSPAGEELFVLVSTMVAVCKAHGLKPIGQLGSVADFSDLQGFEKSARRARQLGCDGGFCIHPDQVSILNRVFSPDPDKVQQAYRVKEAFEAGLTEGRASVSLDGKMVDMPIYKRAIMILEKAAAIDRMKKRKIDVLTGK